MSEVRTSDGKYHIEIRDARGVVIGDNNVVYQYFLDERYRPLAEHLITFDDLIAERTADFVGRAFLDARLATFMEQHDRGYFVLVGEPGIGKTAWAAHVVREHQALHHFNVSAMGIVRGDQALENLCAQIIARFQLDQLYLPVNTGRDGILLDKLLRQAAKRLKGKRLVIVIDALDEAQMPADVRGPNALYLPSALPAGVYIVLTRRPQPMLLETAPGTPSENFALVADLPANQTDVRTYLRQQATKPEIAVRLADRHIPTEQFVEDLAERSAGNFMYLAYLLPDIAAGLFDPLNLTGLPQGLRGYYERFWNELESAMGEGREAWTKFYKPVIGMLAAAREPVSATWIGRILGLDPDEVADFALARWRKFLYRTDFAGEARWRLYHASFVDFLAKKLDGTIRYHSQIADHLLTVTGAVWPLSWPGDWSRLIELDTGYGLRNLASHLASADRWDELHELVAGGSDDRQPWAQTKHAAEGTYAGYVADIEPLWNHVLDAQMSGPRATEQVLRYALIRSSIMSLSEKIPPALLVGLTIQQMDGWTPKTALMYAEQIPDEHQRSETIGVLAGHLPPELVLQALSAVRKLGGEVDRIIGSARVARFLPEGISGQVVSETIQAARSMRNSQDRTRALSYLAASLSSSLIEETLQTLQTVENDHYIAEIMVNLGPHLSTDQVSRALALACNIKDPRNCASAISSLADRITCDEVRATLEFLKHDPRPERWCLAAGVLVSSLPPEARRQQLDKALLIARTEIADDLQCAYALTGLASSLPRDAKKQVIAEALAAGQLEKDEKARAEFLVFLAPQLPKELAAQAYAWALRLRDPAARAQALSGLAPSLPSDLRVTAQREALSAVMIVGDACELAWALVDFAPLLPSHLNMHTLELVMSSVKDADPAVAYSEYIRHFDAEATGQKMTRLLWEMETVIDSFGPAEAMCLYADTLLDLMKSLAPQPREQAIAAVLDANSYIDSQTVLERIQADLDSKWSDKPDIPEYLDGYNLRQVKRLARLASHLSPNTREQVITEALTVARRVSAPTMRVQGIVVLAPLLPPQLRQEIQTEALDLAKAIKWPDTRAHLLECCACLFPPNLQRQILHEAILAARAIEAPLDRVTVLGDLASRLSPPAQQQHLIEALEIARLVVTPLDRIHAFTSLASKLPLALQKLVLDESLLTAGEIKEPEHRAGALLELALRLPAEMRESLLDSALWTSYLIENPRSRAHLLSRLAVNLPENLRSRTANEAILSARSIKDFRESNSANESTDEAIRQLDALAKWLGDDDAEHEYAKVLNIIAPALSRESGIAELGFAESMADNHASAKALGALMVCLAGDSRRKVLAIALSKVQGISNIYERADALHVMACRWIDWREEERSATSRLWLESLKILAMRQRRHFLSDMRALMPLLSSLAGKSGICPIAEAILETGRWWP